MFFSVMLLAELLLFKRWPAKDSEVGETVTGRTPDPLSAAVCGLLVALSVTLRVPLRVPNAVGVNVIAIVHDAPARNRLGDIGQAEVAAKSPVVPIAVIARGAVELFFSVTDRAALVVFMACAPKPRLVGLRLWAWHGATHEIEIAKRTLGPKQRRIFNVLPAKRQ